MEEGRSGLKHSEYPNVHLVAALVNLVHAVAILGLPARKQVEWLNSFGLPGKAELADELADEIGEGCLLLGQFEDAGWITSESRSSIESLNELFEEPRSDYDSAFWLVESLATDPLWAHIRAQAQQVLIQLNARNVTRNSST